MKALIQPVRISVAELARLQVEQASKADPAATVNAPNMIMIPKSFKIIPIRKVKLEKLKVVTKAQKEPKKEPPQSESLPHANPGTNHRRPGLRGVRIDVNALLGIKRDHEKPKGQSSTQKGSKVATRETIDAKPKVIKSEQKIPKTKEVKHSEELSSDQKQTIKTNYQCSHCHRIFSFYSKFENHVCEYPEERSKVKKTYECEHCHQRFVHLSSFQNHLCNFTCTICGKAISNKANLKIHEMYVHKVGDVKYWNCDLCDGRYKSKRNLATHMKVHMKNKPFICAICGKGFSIEGSLKIHMYNHLDKMPCQYCQRSFKPRSLYYHEKRCAKDYEYELIDVDQHIVEEIQCAIGDDTQPEEL